MTGDLLILIVAWLKEPTCRITHGAILDYIMELHGLSRCKARDWLNTQLREAYSTASAYHIQRQIGHTHAGHRPNSDSRLALV